VEEAANGLLQLSESGRVMEKFTERYWKLVGRPDDLDRPVKYWEHKFPPMTEEEK